jgi:hypothetical protein
MKTLHLIAVVALLVLASCGSKQKRTKVPTPRVEKEITLPEEEEVIVEVIEELPDYAPLIFSVQLGIHPLQKNWVLYQNGSYMLFKDALGEEVLTEAANKRMLALVSPRGTKVTKSAMAKGWIVSLGASGVYNYVTFKQIDKGIYEDQEIIDQAISNFIKDQEALEVIKVNQE